MASAIKDDDWSQQELLDHDEYFVSEQRHLADDEASCRKDVLSLRLGCMADAEATREDENLALALQVHHLTEAVPKEPEEDLDERKEEATESKDEHALRAGDMVEFDRKDQSAPQQTWRGEVTLLHASDATVAILPKFPNSPPESTGYMWWVDHAPSNGTVVPAGIKMIIPTRCLRYLGRKLG
jgi:hypothetical protein